MLNKLFPAAQSFYRTCRYVCHDPKRVELLSREGVRGYDYRSMARDFKEIRDLRPQNGKPVFHAVLDFHPDEKIDDARMVEIAKKYLAELGYANAQHVIAKHTDKPHIHMHIIANRVDNNGVFINGFWDMVHSADITKKLTEEYKLRPLAKKDLRLANMEAANKSYVRRYELYRHIRDTLPGCKSLSELIIRLSKVGVYTRVRRNEQTRQKEGVSFWYDGEAFKGRKVDPAFSLPRLLETLSQQELAISEQEKMALQAKQQPVLSQPAKEIPSEKQQLPTPLPPVQKPKHKFKLRIS